MCTKFLVDLVDKVKKSKTKAVFYAIESADNEGVVSKVGTIVDKVVKDGAAKPAVVSKTMIKKEGVKGGV